MMLHTYYHGSRPSGFRQEGFFYVFPISAFVLKICPQGQGHFWPQGHNSNKLGKGPLDASYQISRL